MEGSHGGPNGVSRTWTIALSTRPPLARKASSSCLMRPPPTMAPVRSRITREGSLPRRFISQGARTQAEACVTATAGPLQPMRLEAPLTPLMMPAAGASALVCERDGWGVFHLSGAASESIVGGRQAAQNHQQRVKCE